jgi:hypothetical protein
MNEINILKRNSSYRLEEKLLNTGISVYEFLLFEKNLTNCASQERERGGGFLWAEIRRNHRGLSSEMLK